MVEETNGGTNKANAVSKPNHPKCKKKKKHSRNFMGLTKLESNSRARKVHFVCVENLSIMLESVGTERINKGYSECN